MVHGQQGLPASGNRTDGEKTVTVTTEAVSSSTIAVPPATSVRFGLQGDKTTVSGATDLAKWIEQQRGVNGLQSTNLSPWHVIVSYDQYDEDGDNVHSGIYEEYWTGSTKYKRIYKADDFDQIDYATDKGLFRSGDQHWPNSTQSQVRSEIIDPFYYAVSLDGFYVRSVERTFGAYKLKCMFIEKGPGSSDPTQYCFEPNGSVLRYSRGSGWFQTAYNRIALFQGRNLAQDVDVTNGGKPFLKLRVKTLELLSQIDETTFSPPSDAVGPIGGRVSGVSLMPINPAVAIAPHLPTPLSQQHFAVGVEFVIGKNGHVISAHAVSGPPEAYKWCEAVIRSWVFKPFFVLDKPVEVEQKTSCTYN
jgi:hypothetical protein